MERLIEKKIIEEARKRLARHSKRYYYKSKHRRAYSKRTGKKAKSSAGSVPASWGFHKHYDPRYCINHARLISRGLWKSLSNQTYEPREALRTRVPKANGTHRVIDAFSIPDAAVANIFSTNLRKRNSKIFSSNSFAYQDQKTPLDAVIKVKSLLLSEKIYISQYDFSDFFGSIDHRYINKIPDKSGPFLTTWMERGIIKSIITHSYDDKSIKGRRHVGTPQGHSISLFVANIAAHELDMELSRLNGSFARFADDCVVVNYRYEDAIRCAEAFQRFSFESKVPINREKSSGIRLFSNQPEKAEIKAVDHFEFLSYRFTPEGLRISDRSIRAIKSRCSKIIYNHLLLHPRRASSISAKRIGPRFHDWELVTCLNEIRNYIYGGRSQRSIDRYLSDLQKIGNMSGAVSYFCLIEDSTQLKMLDGWLLFAFKRALAERQKLIKKPTARPRKPLADKKLLDGSWYTLSSPSLETSMPSFFSAWRAARKSWTQHGLGGVDTTGMGYAY